MSNVLTHHTTVCRTYTELRYFGPFFAVERGFEPVITDRQSYDAIIRLQYSIRRHYSTAPTTTPWPLAHIPLCRCVGGVGARTTTAHGTETAMCGCRSIRVQGLQQTVVVVTSWRCVFTTIEQLSASFLRSFNYTDGGQNNVQFTNNPIQYSWQNKIILSYDNTN